MLYLASREDNGPSNASDICQDQNISVSYLEQLFAALRKHDLVIGVRGPGGGYLLARPAGEISIADVVTAVDDRAYVQRSENVVDLYQNQHSRFQGMWRDLSTRLYEFLSTITLAECLQRQEEAEAVHQRADEAGNAQGKKAAC